MVLQPGHAVLTRGRFEEAAAAFRSALHVRPDHSATHNNLGVALKASKQLDEAIQHFERAIALGSDERERSPESRSGAGAEEIGLALRLAGLAASARQDRAARLSRARRSAALCKF